VAAKVVELRRWGDLAPAGQLSKKEKQKGKKRNWKESSEASK
jgi:hypothetical protein